MEIFAVGLVLGICPRPSRWPRCQQCCSSAQHGAQSRAGGLGQFPTGLVWSVEESKHTISPLWNVTVINNPIKSGATRLCLGRRRWSDCWEAGGLPRLPELTRCCVAEHCFCVSVTSCARGVVGQINRSTGPLHHPCRERRRTALKDFLPFF